MKRVIEEQRFLEGRWIGGFFANKDFDVFHSFAAIEVFLSDQRGRLEGIEQEFDLDEALFDLREKCVLEDLVEFGCDALTLARRWDKLLGVSSLLGGLLGGESDKHLIKQGSGAVCVSSAQGSLADEVFGRMIGLFALS